MKNIRRDKKGKGGLVISVIAAAIILGLVWLSMPFVAKYAGFGGTQPPLSAGGRVDTSGDNTVFIDDNQGDTSTVTFQIYDQASTAKSEITPTLVVLGENGNLLVNSVASSTDVTTVVGEQLTVYTESATLYVDAPEPFPISQVRETFDDKSRPAIKGYTIMGETSGTVVVYDRSSNALTKGTLNATSTADYDSLAFGANQDQKVYLELSNDDDQSQLRVGGLCTFAMGDADALKVLDSRFKLMAGVPKEMRDAALSWTNDTGNAQTTTGYDLCYVVDSSNNNGMPYIALDQWESLKVESLIEAGSSNPALQSGDAVGFLFVDYACDFDSNLNIVCDVFRHDDDQEVSDVGLAETEASPQGLDIGAIINLA